MKSLRTIFLAILVSFVFQPAFSKPVIKTSANLVARNFMTQWGNPGNLKSGVKTNFVCEEYGELQNSTGTPSESPAFYIYNIESGGFIIVSGDDGVPPVLAFSRESTFDFDNIPYNVEAFLNDYEKEINYVVKNNLSPSKEIQAEWEKLLNNDIEIQTLTVIEEAEPLTKTKWGYGKPYNDLCPADPAASIKNGGHTPAGCAAIAMAQVLKYWNRPIKGIGSNAFDSDYGILSANFGATTYDWNNMPDMLDNTSTDAQKNAVATLMYHCGISVDMQYEASSSGCYFQYDPIAIPGKNCVEKAFVKYFGYKNSIKAVVKSYSDSIWKELIKKEIVAKRPVIYAGEDKDHGNLGHSFVIDGFKTIEKSDYFHVNWGVFGAYNDGYYLINLLGFDIYNFTSNACILIGIEPDHLLISEDLFLNEPVRIYPNPASDRLYVDLNGTLEDYKNIDILNSLGMKILSVSYSGKQVQIPLDKMTAGVYFIRFNNRETYITKKFMVKK
jgi:hypothetical protein